MARSFHGKLETYEIAKDGLVFVTPEGNPAKNVTVEQLKQIYGSYSIKNWSALGGENKNLIPFCGKSTLDDRQMQLERLILGGAALDEMIAKKHSFDSWNTVISQTQNYHTGLYCRGSLKQLRIVSCKLQFVRGKPLPGKRPETAFREWDLSHQGIH